MSSFHVTVSALALLVSATASGGAYKPPRLADGRPDLQGNWDYVDATPLERPPGINTLVITAEQAAEIEHAIERLEEDRGTPTEPTEYFNERRIRPIRGELRSSVVIDPPNGRIPWTPRFSEWQKIARHGILNAMEGPEQRPNSERCLGNPAAQAPHLFNPGTNLHQIVQTKDAVVFIAEWMNAARIIRLESRHAPAAVTSWSGDSIGWWEGDTLVVETKHFSPSDTGRLAAGVSFKISPQATVIERFTRVADDEINYVFTVEDPEYYTQPWKGETRFMRTADRILEYACHEANYSLTYILQGARVRDAAQNR
jgi:hypothetical protein